MKKLIFLIVILALAAANAFAARIYPAEGRVVDEQGQAVEYATVVLLKGSDQVAGMATDDTGRFVLKVPSGEYTLSVQYLGFDPVVRQVRVEENNDLGEIVMKSSATRIEGVVVRRGSSAARPTASWSTWPTPCGDRQGRHRVAGTRTGV
ncbi:MAG: carboxypeptidase regulatory-like domain-containing protein [Alistipes sp.]